jgi:hypothetical protein
MQSNLIYVMTRSDLIRELALEVRQLRQQVSSLHDQHLHLISQHESFKTHYENYNSSNTKGNNTINNGEVIWRSHSLDSSLKPNSPLRPGDALIRPGEALIRPTIELTRLVSLDINNNSNNSNAHGLDMALSMGGKPLTRQASVSSYFDNEPSDGPFLGLNQIAQAAISLTRDQSTFNTSDTFISNNDDDDGVAVLYRTLSKSMEDIDTNIAAGISEGTHSPLKRQKTVA